MFFPIGLMLPYTTKILLILHFKQEWQYLRNTRLLKLLLGTINLKPIEICVYLLNGNFRPCLPLAGKV